MGTSHIEEVEDGIEIDELTYFQILSKIENNDPFKKVKTASLSNKMKRRFYSLQKKLTGEPDAVGTKYVDPEEVDGYSLYDVVTPPYDQDTLANLYDQSAIHNSSVNARVMNTVGLGYEFIETTKARRMLEKAASNPDRLSRVRKSIQMKKKNLMRFLKI